MSNAIVYEPGAGSEPKVASLELSKFEGWWINTSPAPDRIARVSLHQDGGNLRLRVWLVLRDEPGPADCVVEHIYADSMKSLSGMAFSGRHDFSGFRSEFQGNVNLGLLVLAAFHTYPAGSTYCFTREFFYLAQEETPAEGHVEAPAGT